VSGSSVSQVPLSLVNRRPGLVDGAAVVVPPPAVDEPVEGTLDEDDGGTVTVTTRCGLPDEQAASRPRTVALARNRIGTPTGYPKRSSVNGRGARRAATS
jgi:hypothetical protein